jgi:hypothetical protein
MRTFLLVICNLIVLSSLLPPAREASAWDEDEPQRLDDEHRLQRSRVCDQVSGLERDLAEVRMKYTDWHPRVQILKDRMEQLKRKVGDCSLNHEVIRPLGGWALWVLGADGPRIVVNATSYDNCMKDMAYFLRSAQKQTLAAAIPSAKTPEQLPPAYVCLWRD